MAKIIRQNSDASGVGEKVSNESNMGDIQHQWEKQDDSGGFEDLPPQERLIYLEELSENDYLMGEIIDTNIENDSFIYLTIQMPWGDLHLVRLSFPTLNNGNSEFGIFSELMGYSTTQYEAMVGDRVRLVWTEEQWKFVVYDDADPHDEETMKFSNTPSLGVELRPWKWGPVSVAESIVIYGSAVLAFLLILIGIIPIYVILPIGIFTLVWMLLDLVREGERF